MCTAKGSDVRPGVPLASLGLRLFCVAGVGQCALSRGRMYARGSAGVPGSPPLLRGRRGTSWGNVHCQGVRPGVPLASLGLRLFCVAGVGQCALSRGRMYAPGFRWRPWVSASFAWQAWDIVGQCALPRGWMYALGFCWRPWVSASFAWQAWDNVHCQGVGCTPRGSAGVPGSLRLLRGRRGTMCTVKGSDVRPGVPLASLGLRLFCVAGVGQCALSRGRMYAPGFRWRPWVSASFAWQAWDIVGQCALPRGWMYALGFRWRPWVSASFAWQAWDNVHCQGVGCTPRGSAGVPGSPPLLRGRRGTMCTAKHTHTCSEVSYRITDMECITRAQTLQLNLTGMVE